MCRVSQLTAIYMFSVHPAAFPKYDSTIIFYSIIKMCSLSTSHWGSKLILLTSVLALQDIAESLCCAPISETLAVPAAGDVPLPCCDNFLSLVFTSCCLSLCINLLHCLPSLAPALCQPSTVLFGATPVAAAQCAAVSAGQQSGCRCSQLERLCPLCRVCQKLNSLFGNVRDGVVSRREGIPLPLSISGTV